MSNKQSIIYISIVTSTILIIGSMLLIQYLNQPPTNRQPTAKIQNSSSNFSLPRINQTESNYNYSSSAYQPHQEIDLQFLNPYFEDINKELSVFKQTKEYKIDASICENIESLKVAYDSLNLMLYTVKGTKQAKEDLTLQSLTLSPIVNNCKEHLKGSTQYLEETKKAFKNAQESIKQPYIFNSDK